MHTSHSGTDVHVAAACLRRDELVAIPTETVYGLAGNALSPTAVSKIFAVKNRPQFNPLIVHLHRWEQVPEYVRDIPEKAQVLAEAIWPGPLTLLLPKKPVIPDLVTAGSPWVGIRIPRHPLTQELLGLLDFPLAAPSANPFGYISPTSAGHVARQLGAQIAYILDGGPTDIGLESTIVRVEPTGEVILHRLGGVSLEMLEHLVGPLTQDRHATQPVASGMLKAHYAPRTPLVLGDIDALLTQWKDNAVGILSFSRHIPGVAPAHQRQLSPNRDLTEAASRLFSALHELDEMGLPVILAEPFPEKGLGRAINDRLARAAAAHPPEADP